jgi:hypothetical protein
MNRFLIELSPVVPVFGLLLTGWIWRMELLHWFAYQCMLPFLTFLALVGGVPTT